jgi:hypothetical protein
MAELWYELQRYLTVETKISYISDQPDRPVLLTFTVANSASPPSPTGPEITFEEARLYIRTESDGEVVKELGRLGPRESAVAEHQVPYRDLIQLTHRVVGRVSPETFLTVASEGTPRSDYVAMPVEGYVTVLEEANLHKWLHDTLKGFQVPGPDTTLGDLRKQSQALSESMGEIHKTKERLQKLSSLAAWGKGREAIIKHSTQVTSYLDEVQRAIGQLLQILESSKTETMRSTLDRLIPGLEQSAMRLDEATEGLKQEFVTTSRPVQK